MHSCFPVADGGTVGVCGQSHAVVQAIQGRAAYRRMARVKRHSA